MLIGFIGAPASGKTTIATKLFASLKENSTKTELVVEVARQYIAEKRYNLYKESIWPTNLAPLRPIPSKEEMELNKPILDDEDQLKIAFKQRNQEEIMKFGSTPDTIVVSDSSVFNAALYLSNDFLNSPQRPFFTSLKDHYDMIFFCHPIMLKTLPDDSNRIHSLDEVNKIADKSLKLLKIVKGLSIHTHELLGSLSLEQRYNDACSVSIDYFMELNKRKL